MRSHAMLPTPLLLEDRIRVFFAACDEDLRGRIFFADLDRAPPYRVLSVEERPALDLGPRGSFDCDGVNPSQILQVDGRLLMLYIGWRRDVDGAPYTLFGGLAESRDDGVSFERIQAPLLAPTAAEPLFRTAPFAFRRGRGWELLYIGGGRFVEGERKALPIYSLKHATSERLDRWPAAARELLAPDEKAGEIGFGRPVVWTPRGAEPVLLISRRTAEGYAMIQSPLSDVERGRPLFEPVLGGAREAWEDEMTCFGAPLSVDGAEVLFYNGNQFGRTGFGLAFREDQPIPRVSRARASGAPGRMVRSITVRPTPSIVFVVGPPRSGTTLLAGLLSGRPESYPLAPECTQITAALRSRLNEGPRPGAPSIYVESEEELDLRYRELIGWMVGNAVRHFKRPRSTLVLKDPGLCFVLQGLPRFFEGPVRTVCIVRDPRDVVASQLEVLRRLGEGGTFGDACAAIRDYYDALLKGLDSPDPANPILCVRYEDLVAGEAQTLDALEGFCGYRIEPDAHKGFKAKDFDPKDPWYQETLVGPVTGERVGRYKDILSPEEALRVERTFAPLMERFGYPASPAFAQILELEQRLREKQAELDAVREQRRRDLQALESAAFETELARRTLEEERAAHERVTQTFANDLEDARRAVAHEYEARLAERLAEAEFETERVRQLVEEERRLRAETLGQIEGLREQHVEEMQALERRLRAEASDAAAELQLERDLAQARLATLEGKFLVRLLRPPGWQGTSAPSPAKTVGD